MGRLERVLFSFMGPPQLGDASAPPAVAPVVSACDRCGAAWDEHERVRGARGTSLRCPLDPHLA